MCPVWSHDRAGVCHVTGVTHRIEYGTLDESFVKSQDISKREDSIAEEQVMETDNEVVVGDDKDVVLDVEQEGEENDTGGSCEVDRRSVQETVGRKRHKSLTK